MRKTLDDLVREARAKIEAAGVCIRTVRGFGYLWDATDAAA